VEPTP